MTAVIYARYSSDNQREESIEGQIRECTAYAEKNGITVVKHYIDRALSAKTDNRPDFQQMIKDSEKRLFDIVLVWKLDRFARNRYDSAHYEYQLERNHVKLVSATEPISDSPAGIMVKSMLTGMAEYYSAELSEKVVRGMTENVLKGKYNGGTIPIGFKVDEEKFFQIDPLKAPFVVEAFQRYNDGATMKELMNWLNDSGVTTNRNQKFTYNSVQTLLTNKRYIGENHFKDIVMPDSIPAIVDKDLFEEVQLKIKKNSRAPARHKAEDDYLLTTKLFCGMCGAMMFGECGTGRNKVVHHYYKCATAKRFKTCKKKTVRKEWLEDLVVAETMKLIQDDAVIDAIVAEVMELQDQENTTLPLLEKQMREVENGIENMLNAIQAGVLTNSTKSRLEKLEAQQKELEVRIAEEKIARPRLSENQVRFWLTRFRKLDPNVKSHRETLINTFVNAVYLYDEKVLITFNYKDGTKTITFDEIAAKDASEGNGSDLGCFAPPTKSTGSGWCFFVSPAFQKYVSMVVIQDLLKRICKPDILLLRPFWAPLGVLSGTEELFVFIPPQHESFHVVGGVFQTVLIQHPGALGKAHTRKAVVLCYDHIPRFYPVHQRKVHAVRTFIEHQRLRTFSLDLVRGVAQDDDRNAEPLCNLQSQIDHRAAVCIDQNIHRLSSITHRKAFAVRRSASLKCPPLFHSRVQSTPRAVSWLCRVRMLSPTAAMTAFFVRSSLSPRLR